AHASPKRGEQGEEEHDVKEPIPATLNHPQPAPRSPPSCGRRGGGAAGGRVAGGTTASPPGRDRFSPAPARPVVCPGPPVPGALGAAAAGPGGAASSAVMVNFAQAVRDHWVHILVPLGFVIGCYLDRWNDERLSAFRNKSLLYKRELKPGEEVTWR
uniref:NADH dehydrogenase [ubiquinone] 1 beta subcomplex subunit 1 n=8 Tax=Passeriformes TaxID=9126 RepID=A0A8C3UU65_CATUS